MRHLITITDLTAAEIERIFAITSDIKTKYLQGVRESLLPGRVLALVFEKQSLRTRVSFEAGMTQLGGGSMFLGSDVGFGTRESVPDFARTLSQYVDGIVIRANKHPMVVELAQHSTCPVINGLTDYSHPCQALADLYTLREIGRAAERADAGVGRRCEQCVPQFGGGVRAVGDADRRGFAAEIQLLARRKSRGSRKIFRRSI